ncbi:uncharacterized protein LOC118434914 [Folsomia candida]|uniref:uncharacterized protein LOC118434914 n=1 Tax=Folsomia candida TaxID=158441 RepID=UPI0016054A0E|nr:uncharacterized protein LOC118434914 [Folsomia candida]XP_035705454.1 uncharacterized protein LOC118434914 [Folsomia candida]
MGSLMESEGLGEDEITHIFFLKKLPGVDTANNSVHRNILRLMRSTLRACTTQFQIPRTRETFKNWTQFEDIFESPLAERISVSVRNIKDGDLIPFYLHCQNAGIILSSEKTDATTPVLVLSSFQTSCKSEFVMSQNGDLLVTFPEQSIRINKSEILHSQEFGTTLELLMTTTFSIAQEKATKAGKKVEETRDVVDPMFVTDWLTHLLCNENSETYHDFPQIRKKIRDDVVLGNNVGVPFRRSGLWTTVKVVLQLSLIKELGLEYGIFVFKCVMLLAMTKALEHFHENLTIEKYSSHGTDKKVQMMRKISRRLIKLNSINCTQGRLVDDALLWIEKRVTSVLNQVNQALREQWLITSIKLNSQTQHHSMVSTKNSRAVMLKQICPTLTQETQMRQITNNMNESTIQLPIPDCPDRLFSKTFPSVNNSSKWHEADFELWEIENWIRLHLETFFSSENYSSRIQSLAYEYSRKAMEHYRNDPIGNSRLVLTVLKCIQVLDKIASTEYPTYAKHNSGVDLHFMDRLVLPRLCDMQIAHDLFMYFSNRNSGNATEFPSLIEEDVLSEKSFAVRFAEQSEPMENLRQEILKMIEEETSSKYAQLAQVREECTNLETQIARLQHEYNYDSYQERDVHSGGCKKCSLEEQLKYKLISVGPYEKRLPCSQTLQYAVVFELKIPNEVAILRDVLYFFKVDILNQPWLHLKGIVGTWVSSAFVSQYNNDTETNFKLSSTTKTSASAHYNKNIPVTRSNEHFILKNGLNHKYHGNSRLGSKSDFDTRCTFLISDDNSNYKGMQWAVNWTSHNTNEVLARQCECPPNLSITEFVQFGSLRSGHRLQYRNIVLALTNDSLSWKAEEVFMLICQSQFQYGKSTSSDGIVREAHQGLSDTIFATEILQILEDKIDSNEKKWSDPYTLCSLVAIAGRLLEIGTIDYKFNLKQNVASFLRKCRKIACSWISKLQGLLAKAYAAPESEKNTLKMKLVLSALAATLTFYVSPEHVDLVMTTSDDLLHWLIAMSTLYNHDCLTLSI